jgi:hypothetical protein
MSLKFTSSRSFTNGFLAMGFDSLEFAPFDTCYGGHLKINANNDLVEGQPGAHGIFDGPHSDMSLALGMGDTSKSRIYQGWFNEPILNPLWQNRWSKFSQDEWKTLGEGGNLEEAINYAVGEQTHFGLEDPWINWRLKGQGWLTDIELD